jgi:hypothetical protein
MNIQFTMVARIRSGANSIVIATALGMRLP